MGFGSKRYHLHGKLLISFTMPMKLNEISSQPSFASSPSTESAAAGLCIGAPLVKASACSSLAA